MQKADVSDVRHILSAYRGQDIGKVFREQYYAAIAAARKQQGEALGKVDSNNETINNQNINNNNKYKYGEMSENDDSDENDDDDDNEETGEEDEE